MIVEICANSFESATAAQKGGADRIELCTHLAVGGLTPSYSLIEKVKKELDIPIHVLIRPKKGSFCYKEEELINMINDIEFCKEIGCAGVVSGVLKSNFNVDLKATKRLISAAESLDFTFHRAFDYANNPMKTLEQLIDLKIKRVLSSGQESLAIDGISLLTKMNSIFQNQIEIMPGSGINVANVMAFKNKGFKSIHLSAIKQNKTKSSSFFESGVEGVSELNTIRDIVTLVS